jgi:hypothetical protein
MMIDMEDKFLFGDWNQSVLIAKDKASFKEGDEIVLSGDAEVRLDLLPKPSINIHVKNIQYIDLGKTIKLSSMPFNPLYLELEKIGKSIKGVITDNHILDYGSFVWSVHEKIEVGDEDTKIKAIVFHLFNFKKMLRPVNLKYENWIIELLPSEKSEERFKNLEAWGGYALTHHCYLRKVDNTLFSSKEAEDILSALFDFFSFAKGNLCPPVYPVGIDSSGKKVWESWYPPRVPNFSEPMSWFEGFYPVQLEYLFFGFMAKWFKKDWNKTFHRVLYWYVTANTSNIDSGIILTQTALERISYKYFEENPIDSDPGDAAKKLKKFLCLLDIPVCINEDTPKLKKLAKDVNQFVKNKKEEKKLLKIENRKGPSKWTDAPTAFTEMRNYLVHAEHKYDSVNFNPAMHETWYLGLWYIELSLLRLCGYSEQYCNRLTSKWVGQIEFVPWRDRAT